MAIKDYSVWKATPTSYDAQTPQQDPKSPHIILKFNDGGNDTDSSADINVKSLDSDDRLAYWVNKSFTHPITSSLAELNMGVTSLSDGSSSNLALDFQRTTPKLLDIDSGELLPPYAAGPNNDILDELEPILTQAINEKATIYLFGSYYSDSDGETGIHDIHMNQGNAGDFSNGVYSDGSFLVQFQDGHWEAVFLAFASQSLPTNDTTGAPLSDAVPLDKTLKSA